MTSKRDQNGSLTRRTLLAGAAGALGASVLGGGVLAEAGAAEGGAVESAAQDASVDPTSVQGRLPNELGERSPFVRPRRDPSATSSRTPLQDLHGVITPSDVHFERHHAGVAQVDPSTYRLLIHGMVERPTVFTLDDLLRFPSVSRVHFLECSGNFPTRAGPETLAQNVCGLTSTSEWTGVPLSILLREVGARPEATWMIAEGQDAAVMARSIPMEKAWDDAMIAYGQNGEPLRPEQGYPARLFLPGWEGNTNVKWLRRLELTDGPLMARDETSKYTDPLHDGKVRQFSFVIDARSIITTPSYPQRIQPGWNEIRGIAWSGRGRIAQVEVSVDGGTTWQRADLQEPVFSKAHTRFRFMWNWSGERAEIASRAVDETGYVQPTREQLIAARSARTSYHLNPITAWVVDSDGRVTYREEPWG
ncbi:MAG: sulfite dehydrogenase [Gemmatimonadota bacterium]